MKIKPFRLERYFAKYEFSAPYLLSCSDCEPLTLKELLSMGDNESLELWGKLWLGYTESQGHPLLREEVAKLYSKIKFEDVLIVAPEEGIFVTMNVLLDKRDHIISIFPGYQSLYEVANSLSCEVTKWEPRAEKEWIFDIEFLRSSVKENTKLIVLNFPHNPTGALLSKSNFEQIIEIAREKDIFVFSDEMYRFLEYDKKDRLDSGSDLHENVISLFGVSKTFGLAGLRIGWLTTRNKGVFQKLAIFKDYTTICSSAPSEVLAIMALRAKDKIIKRNLDIIQKNITLLDDFFASHSNIFSWIKPKGGTIGFPELLSLKRTPDFCRDLLEKKGVMLLPATVYDYEGNNLRVGFGRKNMPEALSKLDEYLKENPIS